MINHFIEKVVVYAADKSGGERWRKMDVYLNFMGLFPVLKPEPTAEEIKERERIRKRCEYNRRYREKQRQKEMEREQEENPKSQSA